MKKIYMTLVAVMFAVCASAQVYVGGNVGIASVDNGGDDDETVFSFLPEVGYKFNDDWAAGVMFGWSKGNLSSNGSLDYSGARGTFEINPYARYTFLHSKLINVFPNFFVIRMENMSPKIMDRNPMISMRISVSGDV